MMRTIPIHRGPLVSADVTTSPNPSRRSRAGALLVCLAAVAVFLPCWGAPTFFGSEDCLLRLPVLSYWRNIPTIFSQDFMIYSDGCYRPVGYAILALLRSFVSADCARFWGALLIGLHLLNTLLVFGVLRYLLKKPVAVVMGAALFGLHPVSCVLVHQIQYFHILLGVTFYLGSFLLYLSFRQGGSRSRLVLSLFLYGIGLVTSPVAVTLPLLVAAHETLLLRSGIRRSALLVCPFVALAVAAFCLCEPLHPPPLLYSYSAAKGGEWPSFFSIVAGSHWYILGLSLGHRVPGAPYDLARRVYTAWDARFLFWAVVDAGVLAAGLWLALRRSAVGIGILLAFFALIPFASTAWNPVKEYFSWVYLYLPAAGLAVAAGGLTNWALPLGASSARWAVLAAALLLAAQFGVRLCRINCAARSPSAYWEYVVSLGPASETAQVALGRTYLAEGNVDLAMKHLFTPDLAVLDSSCLALCRYYVRQGNLLAACMHAGLMNRPRALAELFRALSVPDHAEAALGVALSKDPFDTRAMQALAEVLTQKGFIPAARRWLERILEIEPANAAARTLLRGLAASDYAPTCAAKPPRADWLRFLTDGTLSSQLRDDVLRLSESLPQDPVVQIRAAYCLLDRGALAPALDKFAKLYPRLSSFSPLAAVFSWCLLTSGDTEGGALVALQALKRDPTSPHTHYVLGLVLAQNGKLDDAIAHYAEALKLNPNAPEIHYQMGIALTGKGRFEEARQHFARVVQLKPRLARGHVGLADALAELGKTDEALKHFTEALRLEPKNPKTHHDWAVSCYRRGDYAGAWAHVRECRRLGGSMPPSFLKALRAKMPEPNE